MALRAVKQAKVISREVIDQYVALDNEEKEAAKKKKALRDDILDMVADGYTFSVKGPFILEVHTTEPVRPPWRTWTVELLRQVFGKQWKVELKRRLDLVLTKEEKRVDIKVNTLYKG